MFPKGSFKAVFVTFKERQRNFLYSNLQRTFKERSQHDLYIRTIYRKVNVLWFCSLVLKKERSD